MSRGRGYECDENYHVAVHFRALYMYSLLIDAYISIKARTCGNVATTVTRKLSVVVYYQHFPVRTSRKVHLIRYDALDSFHEAQSLRR
jgi:hypothetical protein